jgi:hypothetical protein
MMARSRSTQSRPRGFFASRSTLASSCFSELSGNAFATVLGSRGRATKGIGLAGIVSDVYRNVHNVFHVDQQRRTVATSCVFA